MAGRRKAWEALTAAYRKRLERGGIGKAQYEGGASLRAARGHAQTPEHPVQAYKSVDKYQRYMQRQKAAHLR
ncbi:MAG TPA: hypothetical protein VFO86_10980, partial [Terriglobia bacterium]|nr:hypothetical protein [Terriglobia bacterium]